MGVDSRRLISIAVYGLGKIAFAEHIPTINVSDEFQLAATVSQSKTEPGVSSFETLKELSESHVEVDAVALCMPPRPRHQIAMEVIDAGYDLLLEKPPCLTTDECRILCDAAQRSGVSIFASWHSKFAPMVQSAKEWIEINGCDRFQVVWKENVLKWHPAQRWVSEPGGFGVMDPGINALSILRTLFNQDFVFEDILFYKPSNWVSPIAASFQMSTATDIVGDVDFDWRAANQDVWEIRVFSESNEMILSHGGHKMFINGVPVDSQLQQPSEYTALYNHFSDLIRNRKSDFDATPLGYVEQLYEGAMWKEVEAFNIA